MFTAIPDEFPYRDPWDQTLDERLAALRRGQVKVAYVYERPDTSTFRYRAFNPGLSLEAVDSEVSASWFHLGDLLEDDRFLDVCDLLVMCRTRYDDRVARVVARGRGRGIRVLFDCDDLVFDIRFVHLVVDSLALDTAKEEIWQGWFATLGRLSATYALCDGLVTTNRFLAEQALRLDPSRHVGIMRNYLHPGQQRLSTDMFEAKRRSGYARTDDVLIGYFSGSPTHRRDFAVAAPAIARLMDRDDRVRLRVVGYLDKRGEVMRHEERIEFVPLQDFMNLQRMIAGCEINVAPLQDNLFTNCKSELKYFEAAICGTVTVASPTYAFRHSVRDGGTGFISGGHAWDDVLATAVSLVNDRDRHAAMAEAGHRHAVEAYGWDRQEEEIRGALFGPSVRLPEEAPRAVRPFASR